MPTITINGKAVSLAERTPRLRAGADVTVAGTRLVMPPALYTRQLATIDRQAAYAEGRISAAEIAKAELDDLVATLRRNYPELPDEWVDEWDTADIWALREALIKASTPPQDTASGETPSL